MTYSSRIKEAKGQKSMIITVTFNPAIDKTAYVDNLVVGGLNRLEHVIADVGGKGVNVSKTIQQLQGATIATGFLGGSAGQFILNNLNDLGIQTDFIEVEGQTRTNLKVLNQNMELTELNEPGPIVTDQDIEKLIDRILTIAKQDPDQTWVVLSGNVGPGVNKDIYQNLISRFQQENIKTILDADGELFKNGVKAKPYFIKPNCFELSQYFGVEEELSNEKVIELASTFLNDQTKLVVVSMGIEGSIFLTADEVILAKALTIDYRSAVGAGDAMVAAIAWGLEQNMSLDDLVSWSVATSAGACMSEGTSPASRQVIEQLKPRVEATKWQKIK